MTIVFDKVYIDTLLEHLGSDYRVSLGDTYDETLIIILKTLVDYKERIEYLEQQVGDTKKYNS